MPSIIRIIIIVVLLLAESNHLKAEDISDFESDGCSFFPDGTWKDSDLWQDCCVIHDIAYWQGGTKKQRTNADQILKNCVANHDQSAISKIMFLGVRIGGTPYLPTPYRWGFGWPYPRPYGELNPQEMVAVESQGLPLNKKD